MGAKNHWKVVISRRKITHKGIKTGGIFNFMMLHVGKNFISAKGDEKKA